MVLHNTKKSIIFVNQNKHSVNLFWQYKSSFEKNKFIGKTLVYLLFLYILNVQMHKFLNLLEIIQMKNLLLMVALVVALASCNNATNPVDAQTSDNDFLTSKKESTTVTIKDGILEYADGHYLENTVFKTGYDVFGYNYQAHMFNGSYANAYLGRKGAKFPPYKGDATTYLASNPNAENHWTWEYRDIKLIMKWNDAWLANTDADGNGELDRRLGSTTFIGSGAWLTNHMEGTHADGTTWTYFCKIIAPKTTATKKDGFWYNDDEKEIGKVIWGSFALILEKGFDGDINVEKYLSEIGPGFGTHKK